MPVQLSGRVKAWRAVGATAGGWLALSLVTAYAAVQLIGVNRDFYQGFIDYDPQGVEDQWDELRVSAAMMYTSGHAVGQLCAYLFGVLVAATTGARRPVRCLVVAVLGGAALAAVGASLAWPRAAAQTGWLWMVDELARRGFAYDPDLLREPSVRAFVLTALAAFPLWSLLGAGAGLARPAAAAAAGVGWFLFSGAFTVMWPVGLLHFVVPGFSTPAVGMMVVLWPTVGILTTSVLALWAAALCVRGIRRRRA
jgi:hypothetical protein